MKIRTFLFSILTILLALANTNAIAHTSNDSPQGKYYALVIAIDDYKGNDWTPLKTPVNDAETIKDILLSKYSFEEVVTLYDEKATRSNIINYLDRISQNVTANDNLLVYFSGHGMEIASEGYWVPSDATTKERASLIANNEIKIALSKSVAKHALVMVDACFSGTIFKSAQSLIKNDGTQAYYDQVNELTSRQALTAGGLEPVLDGNSSHSTFATFLIKNLKKNQSPQMDAVELYQKIKIPVQANSPNTPRFGHIQDTGHEGGQFIFRINDEKMTACNFSGVKIKEGEKVIFPQEGGMLHAMVNEYGKKVYYEWVKGTKPLDAEETAALKVTKSGTYTVLVTTDDECSDAAVIEVIVALPALDVTIQEGSEVTFTNFGILHAMSSREDEKVVYEWTKDNFIIGQDADLKVVSDGIYTVVLRLSDGRKIASTTTKVSIKERTYTVRIGDNIERIARKFYGDESKKDFIYEANLNTIKKGELLRVGTELSVPLLAEEEAKAANDVNNRVYIAANDDMPPFSQVGLLNNGMLTDMVKSVYKNRRQVPVVDFVNGNILRANTFRGKATAAFPCVYSADEAGFFYYSDPLYQELTMLFINKEPIDDKAKEIKFSKDKDLKGMRIGVVRGFTCEKLVTLKNEGVIGIGAFNTWEECFKALQEGKIDIVAAPQSVGIYTLRTESSLNLKDFTMLEKELEVTPFYLVISKNHPEGEALIKDFNLSLKELKDAGEISKIQNTHIDIFQNID